MGTSKQQKLKTGHAQRVANRSKVRKMQRPQGITAYAMDRLLFRLSKSQHAKKFALKGGVLVAMRLKAPHRYTPDIDLLKTEKGPPSPEAMKKVFEDISQIKVDDGLVFGKVKALKAERKTDDYDGVKLEVHGTLDRNTFVIGVDIGFGDVIDPKAKLEALNPFLEEDDPARIFVYPDTVVMAEKIETLLSKFPDIAHRLKDLLDVYVMDRELTIRRDELATSLNATMKRRKTPTDRETLDEFLDELSGRKWETEWAKMVKEKVVKNPPCLSEATTKFVKLIHGLFETIDKMQ